MSTSTAEDIDVSVIVAVRNGADTLRQCIESAARQSACRTEVLVIDAMSEDGTEAVVRSFGSKIGVYIREPDSGIYDAWNKALRVACGSWCIFLGADDYFLSDDSLSRILECARSARPRPAIVHGGIIRTGGVSDYEIHPDPANALEFLRSGRMLPHQGMLHCTDALRGIGGFDADFSVLGDVDAALRLLVNGRAVRCPSVVVAMRIGGISTAWDSQRLIAAEKFRLLRRERGMAFALGFYVFTRSAQSLARSAERILLRLLGAERGVRCILRVRRVLGRPSKRL